MSVLVHVNRKTTQNPDHVRDRGIHEDATAFLFGQPAYQPERFLERTRLLSTALVAIVAIRNLTRNPNTFAQYNREQRDP